jgi:uncharacterized membrane protein
MNNYLLINSLIFFSGLILFIFPPKKINWYYGYRTPSSTKNQTVFKYANRISSIVLMVSSIIIYILTLLLSSLFNNINFNWLFILTIISVFIITEIKIKQFKRHETNQ